MRAKGMSANVVVCEVDPLRALEANMDGFLVMPIAKAARVGDIFVTTTGDISVIRKEHFPVMKDGAILDNSGHFNVEIDLVELKTMSIKSRMLRDFVQEFTLRKNKKRIYILGEGRLINLAAAEGHPAQVMDMSFANQALSAEYIKKHCQDLDNNVYPVPKNLDSQIALLKLRSLGIGIDKLTPKQKKYLASWQEGT
jgi:adenosylhomocysteinase